jgi:hypothetical protein
MPSLSLSFACWDYDRVRPLADKSVRPEGVDLNFLRIFPAETFQRMIKHGEFDLCEMVLRNGGRRGFALRRHPDISGPAISALPDFRE